MSLQHQFKHAIFSGKKYITIYSFLYTCRYCTLEYHYWFRRLHISTRVLIPLPEKVLSKLPWRVIIISNNKTLSTFKIILAQWRHRATYVGVIKWAVLWRHQTITWRLLINGVHLPRTNITRSAQQIEFEISRIDAAHRLGPVY